MPTGLNQRANALVDFAATTYLGPLVLPRRALDFCFLPGGPPELPRGVLASPCFFGFAMLGTLRSESKLS